MPLFSLHFNPVEQTARKNISAHMNGIVQTTTRLATGLRVNSAKDDPAAFIGAELMKSENVEIKAQIKANQQIGNRLSVKETYLASIGNLLTDLKGAIVEGASEGTLSDDQRKTLQLQIDYVVDAIQRISNTATFKGEKLFDGLFSSLGASDGWSEWEARTQAQDGTTVLGDEQQTLSTAPLRTDALRSLVLQFSGGDEQQGLFLGVTNLLNRIAVNAGAETFTISAEPVAEGEADETGVETDTNPDPDTETVEGKTDVDETVSTTSDIPDETASESESTEETTVETETSPEADAEEAEMNETATEEETPEDKEAREKAEKNAEAIAEYTSDPYGGYVFRHLDEFDYLNEEETKEEDRTIRFDVGVSMNSLQSGLSGMLLQGAVLSTTGNKACCQDDPADSPDKEMEENEEDAEEEFLSGTLSDLKSGGKASLQSDPARADQIIDRAISFIAMQRAEVGAEIKYTVNVNISLLQDRLYQNESAIADLVNADYATEVSNLARHQILLQSSMKALQISREIPRMLLSILDAGYDSLRTDARKQSGG